MLMKRSADGRFARASSSPAPPESSHWENPRAGARRRPLRNPLTEHALGVFPAILTSDWVQPLTPTFVPDENPGRSGVASVK
jgi:hypothetical protein